MPPLFVYAVAFLSILTIVGFVVCLRESSDGAELMAVPAGAQGHALARTPVAAAPAPRGQPAQQGQVEAQRQAARPGEAALRAPRPGASAYRPAPIEREPFTARPAAPFESPVARSVPNHAALSEPAGPAAGDALSRQVAHLAEQVAELKAERQLFEDEIRRLHRVVQDATATIDDLNASRSTKTARSPSSNVRHINVSDLRIRRVS